MPLPNELTDAVVECFATGFFHKYKMEAFLTGAGVPPAIIERHRGPMKSVWARSILIDLGQRSGGYEIQRRIIARLCDLTSAPDPNAKIDRQAAGYALEHLRNVARRYRESLACAVFDTADSLLNALLEYARQKFLAPDLNSHSDALEKLWDAWERLKTLEASDKKRSVGLLLDRASPEVGFRELLEAEAKALTDIGNSFMIRHSEVGKTPILNPAHTDYLFHRLFALIQLLLRTTGRGG